MVSRGRSFVKRFKTYFKLNESRLCLALCLSCTVMLMLCGTEAFAMTDDSMKKGLTTLENSLTGSWMRLGLIVGGFIGTVTSFIKQSPIGLVASAGTGLGAVFFTDWVKTAFTATIDLLS